MESIVKKEIVVNSKGTFSGLKRDALITMMQKMIKQLKVACSMFFVRLLRIGFLIWQTVLSYLWIKQQLSSTTMRGSTKNLTLFNLKQLSLLILGLKGLFLILQKLKIELKTFEAEFNVVEQAIQIAIQKNCRKLKAWPIISSRIWKTFLQIKISSSLLLRPVSIHK